MKTTRTPYRRKRSETLMKTIEKKYGKEFNVLSDMEFGNFLKEKGYSSLSELLKL